MDDSEEDFPDWRAVKEVGQPKIGGRRNEKSYRDCEGSPPVSNTKSGQQRLIKLHSIIHLPYTMIWTLLCWLVAEARPDHLEKIPSA